jgi:hypothetical protein
MDDWVEDLNRLLRDGLVLVERDWTHDDEAVPRFRVTRRGQQYVQTTTDDETNDHGSRIEQRLRISTPETTHRRVG